MSLVSISQSGSKLRLRRYVRTTRILTHDGCYVPGGCTPLNVEYYRQWGAPQDRVAQKPALGGRRVRATSSA